MRPVGSRYEADPTSKAKTKVPALCTLKEPTLKPERNSTVSASFISVGSDTRPYASLDHAVSTQVATKHQ
ncbi:hypothetical protein FHS27_004293 [Rhodopirellula rubra]|uniref:Uncharacterized protein n=1 Tax=Aporhodopirellula rubra TaxID=980271 RepID=A0A7W5H7I2_9BACT|nr:hypothetical protein [Aporhodopirellula rubra]